MTYYSVLKICIFSSNSDKQLYNPHLILVRVVDFGCIACWICFILYVQVVDFSPIP